MEFLTVDRVKQLVQVVEAGRGDSEVAHTLEDDLYRMVLEAIANGACYDPQACAAQALKTQELSFDRWHA